MVVEPPLVRLDRVAGVADIQGVNVRELIKLYLYNAIYTILVIPSFVFFIMRDSTDQFAALFIGFFTFPWSLAMFLVLGFLNLSGVSTVDLPNSLFTRGLILLLFVALNEILIYKLASKYGRKQR